MQPIGYENYRFHILGEHYERPHIVKALYITLGLLMTSCTLFYVIYFVVNVNKLNISINNDASYDQGYIVLPIFSAYMVLFLALFLDGMSLRYMRTEEIKLINSLKLRTLENIVSIRIVMSKLCIHNGTIILFISLYGYFFPTGNMQANQDGDIFVTCFVLLQFIYPIISGAIFIHIMNLYFEHKTRVKGNVGDVNSHIDTPHLVYPPINL